VEQIKNQPSQFTGAYEILSLHISNCSHVKLWIAVFKSSMFITFLYAAIRACVRTRMC
jgi:hypothetical protein